MATLYSNGGVIGSTLDYNSSVNSYNTITQTYKKPYRVADTASGFFAAYTSNIAINTGLALPGDFALFCVWIDNYNQSNEINNMSIGGLTQVSKVTTGTTSSYKNGILYIGYKFLTEQDLSTKTWSSGSNFITNLTSAWTQSDKQYAVYTCGIYRNVNTVTPISGVITTLSPGYNIPQINNTSITPQSNDSIIVMGVGGWGSYNGTSGYVWPNVSAPNSYGTVGQTAPFSPPVWYNHAKVYEQTEFTSGLAYTPTLPTMSPVPNAYQYSPASIGFKLLLNGGNDFNTTAIISNKENSGIWDLNSAYQIKKLGN